MYTMCDGASGILTGIEIVTGSTKKMFRDMYNCGTATVLQICQLFPKITNRKHPAVDGDSFLASLECAMALKK